MDNLFSGTVSPRRFSSVLVAIFAGLALLLAAFGIYGVTSYSASRRTQEMRLRIALGAQTHTVRRLILGQTLNLTLVRRDRRVGGFVSSGAFSGEPALRRGHARPANGPRCRGSTDGCRFSGFVHSGSARNARGPHGRFALRVDCVGFDRHPWWDLWAKSRDVPL